MPKKHTQNQRLSLAARALARAGSVVPKPRIKVKWKKEAKQAKGALSIRAKNGTLSVRGKRGVLRASAKMNSGVPVPIGRHRSVRYVGNQPEAPYVVEVKNNGGGVRATKTYSKRSKLGAEEKRRGKKPRAGGKLVSVSYPKGSLENIGRTVAKKRRKPTANSINMEAGRRAKKWALESRKVGYNRNFAKEKRERWIREQAVGMALRDIGVFSKPIRAKIHELYATAYEVEYLWRYSRPKKPSETELESARKQLKKILGPKYKPFLKSRDRYRRTVKIALKRAEEKLAANGK